jgi:lysozyme
MAKRKAQKKNTINKWWIIIPAFLIAITTITYLWYKHQYLETARFVKYPAFGIDIPDSYDIHGIDVSWYQNLIDWPSVKEMKVRDVQIGFAFIKATEGVGNVDRQFKRNWRKAKQAGITRGAYHFFLPNKSGKTQAKNFIASVDLQPGDLPPVLDIEQLYGVRPDKMRKEVQDWLDAIEEYYHVKPIIYTYVNFYSRFMEKDFDKYPLWAAHYHEKNKPRINRPWLFWQHSEKGRVNGILTRVDFNVFNGDRSDFKNLLIK